MTKAKLGSYCLMNKYFISRLGRRDKIDVFVLLLLAAINGIIAYFWLLKDFSPLFSDEAYYLYITTQYYDIFSNPNLSLFKDFIAVNEFRPPFRLVLVLPFYAIWGISREVAVLSNSVFFIILLFSTYLICRRLFSRDVGLLAGFIVATTPILTGLSHSYLSDFPLAAMVTLGIYLLLRTEYFTNRKFSYLFGLVFGLNLLIKIECLMFLLLPTLYIMYKADIFKIGSLMKFLIKNIGHTIIIIISGICFGIYFYVISDLIIWPGNEKFGLNLLIMFMILGIITISIAWLLIGITIANLSLASKKLVLKRDSLTYLSAGLLLIFLYQYRNPIEFLHVWVLIGAVFVFLLSKYLLLKKYISTGWRNLRKKRFFNHPWINLMRGTFVMLISTLWWYIPAGRRVIPFAIYNPLLPKEREGGHENLLSWESVSYYFLGLVNQQIYLYFWFFILAVILILYYRRESIIGFFKNTSITRFIPELLKSDKKALLIFVLWIVVPYIVLSMSHVKNSRYVSPYLPAIGIIIAYGLLLLKPWWKKVIVIALIIVVGLSQLFLFSFGSEQVPENVTIDTPLGEIQLYGTMPLGRHQYIVHPSEENWRIEEILGDIYDDSKFNQTEFTANIKTVDIGTITGSYNLHWENLRLYSSFNGYNFEFYTGTSFYEQEKFYDNFNEFAYLIVLNNSLDPNSQWVKDYLDSNDTGYLKRDFVILNSYELPNETKIDVYKRSQVSVDYKPPSNLPDLV